MASSQARDHECWYKTTQTELSFAYSVNERYNAPAPLFGNSPFLWPAKEANVALTFPSPEWTTELQTVVNNDQAYAQSAKTWEGDFYFVIEAGPGIAQPVKMYLDLWHGKCREAHIVSAGETKQPEFTISGTLDTYRRVFEKKLDPIQALMTRKLKVQGNMMKIVRSVKPTLDLVNCCSLIPTNYPDQVRS